MEELNARFEEFVRTLRPTDPQKNLAKDELDFIEGKFESFEVEDHTDFSFKKALRSGSYAKKTSLRRHEEGDFDADIGIYFDVEDPEALGPHDLLDHVESVLRRAYKNRTERQPIFDRSVKSAVRIKFEVSPKINIDAVPIVSLAHSSIDNYGYIPRRDSEKRKTSVTEHVQFISDRNKLVDSTPFNHLLMIFKWWRNNNFDNALRDKCTSFFMELVVAKAFDQTYKSFTDNWLDNLLQMGTWMLRQRMAEPIYFPDKRIPLKSFPKDAVVALDPVNVDNNIAAEWTTQDREAFLKKIQILCDHLNDAKNEALADDVDSAADVLDQVFPNFSTWSEA